MQQLCRELLLLESSDWQFLITTGAARDYAEIRFLTHNDQFNEIKSIWQSFESAGVLTQAQEDRLAEIERRDGVFPDIDPGLWVAGAHQSRPDEAAPSVSQERQLTEALAKSRAAAAARPRTVSDEAAKRAAAESTKYDGVPTEQGVTHDQPHATKKP
jgi:1,4-alpha-glucan branching enzyme